MPKMFSRANSMTSWVRKVEVPVPGWLDLTIPRKLSPRISMTFTQMAQSPAKTLAE